MDDPDGRGPGEVFAIPDLWEPSRFLSSASENPSSLFSGLKLDDIDERLPDGVEQPQPEDVFFSIPDLSFGPTENVSTPSQSTSSHKDIVEEPDDGVGDDGDIWLLPDELPVAVSTYQSWDAFENMKFKESHSPYITEAGPSIFDTAAATREDYLRIGNTSHVVVDGNVYTSSILALGLGRSSVLFAWDAGKQSFLSALPKHRISGYSEKSLDGLLIMFFECGNITRNLQAFIEKTYTTSTSPGRIALADALCTLLATIQSRLSASASTGRSILQLQSLFQPAHSILTCFQRVVVNISATRSDESMLSTVFEEVQLLEHRTDSLREIFLEILSRVSQPWLEFTGEWLGLEREAGLPVNKEGKGKSFVKVENKAWIDDQGLELQKPDYVLNYDKVPAFIQPDEARAMFEVGRSLRFLRTHHTEHPLARADVIAAANPPMLGWKFSWQDILQVESKALQYEKNLTSALLDFSRGVASVSRDAENALQSGNLALDVFGKPEEDIQAHVLASINVFDRPLIEKMSPDRLSLALDMYLTSKYEMEEHDSIFAPPISLAPILSFNPIIRAQARIVNGTCMRMFFRSHKLREHLSLQQSFHLLGNGVFSSKLTHALFDPELESAERHRGVARSGGIMGLRLVGRDTWPPASSELRLALMGVLMESYISTEPLSKLHAGTCLDQSSLPGDLSFAVRDMSQEQIEKCLDPDSVEALDFLRLSYKPPAPLEAVITPVILFKYDQIFKLLLRVIRMLYVVSALFRDATDRNSYWQGIDYVAQRFRIEAHHFVSSVCGYFFDTGIETTWRIFERKLNQIEDRINIDDDNVTLGQNEGLDKLRDYHERVLDRIMFTLLLRKRQQPVLKLLEEIFALILQFSKHSWQRTLGLKREVGSDNEVREVYLKFKKKVGVFINVCRGLSERRGYAEKRTLDTRTSGQEGLFDGDELAEENTIAHLLTRLEMSNYYSRDLGR